MASIETWTMCSTRNVKLIAAAMAVVGGLVGCERVQPPPPRTVALQPEPTTEHLIVPRDFDRSVAVVPSGVTVAYSTRYVLAPASDMPEEHRAWMNPALFFVNTALAPLTYIATPPFTWREYAGLSIPPSHTAQPLLPESYGRFGESRPPTDLGPYAPSETPGMPDVDIAQPSD